MGFFDDAGRWGSQLGEAIQNNWPGSKDTGMADAEKRSQAAPPPPPPDPSLLSTQQQRTKEASDFRANLPGMSRDLGTTLENTGRRQLASDIAQNKMSANRRGLLGSGMNQAQDASASGKIANSVAQGKQQMTDQLQNQADVMEQAAINNGYQYWQSAKGVQDAAYNAALSNMMAARSGTTAIIGAASKGAALAMV